MSRHPFEGEPTYGANYFERQESVEIKIAWRQFLGLAGLGSRGESVAASSSVIQLVNAGRGQVPDDCGYSA